MKKSFFHLHLAGVSNGYGYRLILVFSMSYVRIISTAFISFSCTEIVNHLDNESCSFKPTFLFLMISWMALIHVVVNLAGSDFQRCEFLVGIVRGYELI